MINRKEFERLQKGMENFDAVRETVIKKSRDVIKLSKSVIYAVHRNNMGKAAASISSMKKELKVLQRSTKNYPNLYYSGSVRVAEQEFVEAVCFYEFIKNEKIPTARELQVDGDSFLLGLCDLTGELVRKAINASIQEKFSESIRMKDCVSEIYGELMKFDFRGGELRKKFDSIKYDLKKLEDLALQLKLKGHI